MGLIKLGNLETSCSQPGPQVAPLAQQCCLQPLHTDFSLTALLPLGLVLPQELCTFWATSLSVTATSSSLKSSYTSVAWIKEPLYSCSALVMLYPTVAPVVTAIVVILFVSSMRYELHRTRMVPFIHHLMPSIYTK